MTEQEDDDYINDLKARLPLPSEIGTDTLVIPIPEDYDLGVQCPTYGQLVFEKEYVDGIAIGWRLKE